MTKKELEEKIILKLERLDKRVDLLDGQMQGWERVEARQTALEEQIKLLSERIDHHNKDIKEEIQIANDKTNAKVETKIEEVTDQIETKKIVQVKKGKPWYKFW